MEAETTLQSVQAGATNVGIARAQYEHAIAVLLGKTPSNFSIPVKPMTVAPPPIPVGVPSQLLERRPDVAAAERTMAEANAAIGIAYAAYYPNLSLTAGGVDVQLGQLVFGPSERHFPKPFTMLGCAAPRFNNTLRPTMPISLLTDRLFSPHSSRWKMVWRRCASCPRKHSSNSRR